MPRPAKLILREDFLANHPLLCELEVPGDMAKRRGFFDVLRKRGLDLVSTDDFAALWYLPGSTVRRWIDHSRLEAYYCVLSSGLQASPAYMIDWEKMSDYLRAHAKVSVYRPRNPLPVDLNGVTIKPWKLLAEYKPEVLRGHEIAEQSKKKYFRGYGKPLRPLSSLIPEVFRED